jgi:hypothetical protein
MSKLEDKLQESKLKASDGLKKHIFDWVAAIIIISLIAASLDIFGLVSFNTINFVEFLVSWFPYFAASILLNSDLYKKGVFVAKHTPKFKGVILSYSKLVDSLSGKQIKNLHPFCEEYNDDAKKSIQTQILRAEGLTFEDFDVGDENNTPLKVRTKQQLLQQNFTKQQCKAIRTAKRVKIKGINVNVLLSNNHAMDITCIGEDEKSLSKKRMIFSAARYMITTLLLSVIAIKDISDWGWLSLVLTLFKVAYLFAGCCMSYFKGYDDITIHLTNHFNRKIDILRIYLNYEHSIVKYVEDTSQ